MRKSKAFTLVELLVVIAIIAVLLSILLPSLRHVKELGKRVRCAKNLQSIGMAMKFYADTFDGSLPELEFASDKPLSKHQAATPRIDHPYWICRDFMGTPTQWADVFGFGCLSLRSTKFVENPIMFYCPADDLWHDIYNAYASPSGWGAAKGTNNDPRYTDPGIATDIIRVTYVYFPETRKRVDTARLITIGGAGTGNTYEVGCPEVALKLADVDSSKAMSCDNGGHSLGGATHTTTTGGAVEVDKGHNVVFGDGHVNFQTPPVRDGITMHIRQEVDSVGSTPADNVAYFMSHLQP
jgi:prepilin-type N-terminal cleavage/methylation domain-containing protein